METPDSYFYVDWCAIHQSKQNIRLSALPSSSTMEHLFLLVNIQANGYKS